MGEKGISCMATGTMPEMWYQYLEGVKHPPSYLCTGQEVQWNQPNQKHEDSKTMPARGVISMDCGETPLSCSQPLLRSLSKMLQLAPISPNQPLSVLRSSQQANKGQ